MLSGPSGKCCKQPERLVRLYTAEMQLGRNSMGPREKDLVTPLFPLLGVPNESQEGYYNFIAKKIGRQPDQARRRVIKFQESSSNVTGGDNNESKSVIGTSVTATVRKPPTRTKSSMKLGTVLPPQFFEVPEIIIIDPSFKSVEPLSVCELCNVLLEMYRIRNRTIVFRSQSIVDKMNSLQDKLIH
jgi:hypothetical protein